MGVGVGVGVDVEADGECQTRIAFCSCLLMSRVGQNHIYTVYIPYFCLGNHQIYGVYIYVYIRFWPTLLMSHAHLMIRAD